MGFSIPVKKSLGTTEQNSYNMVPYLYISVSDVIHTHVYICIYVYIQTLESDKPSIIHT